LQGKEVSIFQAELLLGHRESELITPVRNGYGFVIAEVCSEPFVCREQFVVDGNCVAGSSRTLQ
jgi:hypothetical protein